ncbi:hypothetical protein SUDANB95_07902 (plasmid) [Actinosynnema sp. ALI-1.44]
MTISTPAAEVSPLCDTSSGSTTGSTTGTTATIAVGRLPVDVAVRPAAHADPRDLVRQLEPFIRRRVAQFARTPLPAHLACEDLAQDACLSVLRALPIYPGPLHELTRWVSAIVRRRVAEVYREPKTWRHLPVADLGDTLANLDDQDAVDARVDAETGQTATELLAHLDERSRRIVLLHCVDGLLHTEIATRLGSRPSRHESPTAGR